jgi:sugar phosphate isomerase/epimerase
MPLRRSLPDLRKLGVAGVELEAVGDLAPAQLSDTGRRELRHLLRSHDLELSALACPLRRGLAVSENQEARVDYLRQALSMSWDLGAKIVVIEPGPIRYDDPDPRKVMLEEALTALGRHGDHVGATLALETGLEAGEALATFLDGFSTGGLGANLNPGNLLIHGHDPYAAARSLRHRVVHVHAKDARLASASGSAQDVALGHGDIDWLQMIATLEEIEYRGFVTIERVPGANPLAEAKAAVEFLQRFLR